MAHVGIYIYISHSVIQQFHSQVYIPNGNAYLGIQRMCTGLLLAASFLQPHTGKLSSVSVTYIQRNVYRNVPTQWNARERLQTPTSVTQNSAGEPHTHSTEQRSQMMEKSTRRYSIHTKFKQSRRDLGDVTKVMVAERGGVCVWITDLCFSGCARSVSIHQAGCLSCMHCLEGMLYFNTTFMKIFLQLWFIFMTL